MQVYRRMEIGTAKPPWKQRRMVPHHLIDIADPDEPFDAARYLEAAGPVIEEIRKRGKVPLVVGGTGLYIRVLTRGLCQGPPSDPEVKRRLIADEKSKGLRELYGDLLRIDPESAARIHPNDRQRIIRALEVFYIGGVPLSVLQERHGFREQLRPAIKVFINLEREMLYERIDRRVDRMIEAGLKDEVEGLLAMGYSAELKSMQSIGYRQMCDHIAGGFRSRRPSFGSSARPGATPNGRSPGFAPTGSFGLLTPGISRGYTNISGGQLRNLGLSALSTKFQWAPSS